MPSSRVVSVALRKVDVKEVSEAFLLEASEVICEPFVGPAVGELEVEPPCLEWLEAVVLLQDSQVPTIFVGEDPPEGVVELIRVGYEEYRLEVWLGRLGSHRVFHRGFIDAFSC